MTSRMAARIYLPMIVRTGVLLGAESPTQVKRKEADNEPTEVAVRDACPDVGRLALGCLWHTHCHLSSTHTYTNANAANSRAFPSASNFDHITCPNLTIPNWIVRLC